MDPVWVGMIATVAVQIIAVVYLAGRYTARFDRVEKWIADEGDPMLAEHEKRITVLEVHRR